MNDPLYHKLYTEGLLSDDAISKLRQKDAHPLFSLHLEIKTILYTGVLMLTAGLGILIYENIATIGHQFILAFIALIFTGCFTYCLKYKLPFSREKVNSPNSFFDYILLLGSISLLTFIGYLQFQYKVFGVNYGLATLIPMLILFFTAYYFDHIGILSMAIANLAIWMGVSVTPKQLLLNYNFNSELIIYTYLLLAVILLSAAYSSGSFNLKKHFKFSYQHYGIHVGYITLLAGYFYYYNSYGAVLWMLGILLLSLLTYNDAFRNRSFYFLLLVVLYSYIAVSCSIVRGFMAIGDISGIYLILLYFIISGIALIFLMINLNQKLKSA